jgi:hypothetical protein
VIAMQGDSRFWVFFGSIWLLVGAVFLVISLGAVLFPDAADAEDPVLLWIFLAAGVVIAAAGVVILRRALAAAARDKRLMEAGLAFTARVTDIRRSPVDINRQARWHVHYRYDYAAGRTLEGRSRALPAHEVEGLAPGTEVRIKVDPGKPEESLYLGRPG